MLHNAVKIFSKYLICFCLLTQSLCLIIIQPDTNEGYHLNLTNCEERFQTRYPVFLQLLEMDACSKPTGAWPYSYKKDTSYDPIDGSRDELSVANFSSILINYTHLEALFNNEFCKLPKLQQLILPNNRFQDGDLLGFGKNCEPSACGHQLQTLDLEGNHLKSVRANSFLCNMRSLAKLFLQNNDLQDIEVNAFGNATRLSLIHMSNNSLVGLESGTFGNLPRLRTLDLSHNKLNRIDCFGDRDQLTVRHLYLNNNEIRTLESGVFKGLMNVTYLTLANNHISSVADGAFNMNKTLVNLHLKYNNLSRLSQDTLRGLYGLVTLELDNNEINFIHPEAFQQIPNLLHLTLDNNMLNAVPLFSGMGKLKNLYLGHNFLDTITDGSFQNLTALKILDLSFNQINQLDEDCFQNLAGLKTLNLAHNQLTSKEHLVNGYVSSFSENATQVFQNLIHLDLSNNLMTEFHFHIPFYIYTYSLKSLNLSHNNITRMNIDAAYEPILQLVVLDLSHNSIPELNFDHVFLTNTPESIEDIYLNDNKIQHVESVFLQQVPTLKNLKLSNNLLTSLDFHTVFPRGNIAPVILELAGNPWNCDCHLEWLNELISNPTSTYFVKDYSRLVCARQFHRFRNVSVPLIQAIDGRDFMCSFVLEKRTSCLPSAATQCLGLQSCPESCACHRTSNWNEVIVDCHARNLTTIPKDIPVVTTSWYLDGNIILELRVLSHLPFLTELLLNHTNMKTIDANAFSQVPSLERLFLQDNMLEVLPHDIFGNLSQLVELNLANNRLSELSLSLFMPLLSLETLNFNENNLREFSVWGLATLSKLSRISLHDNPWSCACSFVLQFTQWMYNESKKLADSNDIYCLSHEDSEPVYLNWFDESTCLNSTSSPALGLTPEQSKIVISSMVALFTILVLLMIIYFFRRDMQVLIYSRYGLRLFHPKNEDGDKGKLHDAFVSYSSLDEDFIVHHLLPGLEGIPRPYRICLHHRDFPIGAFINESIYTAIDQSCRTIIILSPNFVQSEWCKFEFRTAHAQMLQDRQNRVIVILLGQLPPDANIGPEMRLYLRTNTYLCWGDKLFWKKLYFVLPEKEELIEEVVLVADDIV